MRPSLSLKNGMSQMALKRSLCIAPSHLPPSLLHWICLNGPGTGKEVGEHDQFAMSSQSPLN